MAATFEFDESNGAGETVTHNVTQVNWKDIDDVATAYTANPITDGNNSYEKFQNGHISGTFNTVLNGRYAHTAVAFGAGLTLKGQPSMTTDTDKEAYTQPATTANANLTVDMTSVTAIGSGQVVWFAATSPTSTMTASQTTDPCYTNYLVTQLQTSGAAAGDTATVTMTLQYDEN